MLPVKYVIDYFEFVKIVSCWYLSLIFVPLFQQDEMNDPHHKHL